MTPCCSRSIRWRAPKTVGFNLSRYAHLLAILLLAVAIAGLAYLLINEDRAMQRDALTRDVDTVAQSLSLRLQTMTEATTSIGLEIGDAKYNESRFASTGRELMMSNPSCCIWRTLTATIGCAGRCNRPIRWPIGPVLRLPRSARK